MVVLKLVMSIRMQGRVLVVLDREVPIHIRFDDRLVQNYGITLSHNEPNPVKGQTKVQFTLYEEQVVNLTFTHVKGQMIMSMEMKGFQGLNTFLVSRKHLQAQCGVVIYEVKTPSQALNRKMMLVN